MISLIGGPLAVIPLIAVPIVLVAGIILQFPLRHAVEKTYRESAQRHALLVETLSGVEAIKAAGAEGHGILHYLQQCSDRARVMSWPCRSR